MPRRFSSTTSPMPGLPTAVVTVPVITRPAPSRAAIAGSLSTPFCRDSTGGRSAPVASSPSSAAPVSNDFSANTATSYGPAARASAAESKTATLLTVAV